MFPGLCKSCLQQVCVFHWDMAGEGQESDFESELSHSGNKNPDPKKVTWNAFVNLNQIHYSWWACDSSEVSSDDVPFSVIMSSPSSDQTTHHRALKRNPQKAVQSGILCCQQTYSSCSSMVVLSALKILVERWERFQLDTEFEVVEIVWKLNTL